MIILRNPQIAELIEAGCAFKSNVIISSCNVFSGTTKLQLLLAFQRSF